MPSRSETRTRHRLPQWRAPKPYHRLSRRTTRVGTSRLHRALSPCRRLPSHPGQDRPTQRSQQYWDAIPNSLRSRAWAPASDAAPFDPPAPPGCHTPRLPRQQFTPRLSSVNTHSSVRPTLRSPRGFRGARASWAQVAPGAAPVPDSPNALHRSGRLAVPLPDRRPESPRARSG